MSDAPMMVFFGLLMAAMGAFSGMFLFDCWRPGGFGGTPGHLQDDPRIYIWVVGGALAAGAAWLVAMAFVLG